MILNVYSTINNKLDKLLRKRMDVMPLKPPSFPLQSVQQVMEFNTISQDEYDNAVSFQNNNLISKQLYK